ncbi:hypothetical protein [Couchioplanes caeruleus]|uniref:Uncharacterized protein n=2 Tax=Couchioplanes caeruleus TaxID=56438 RepID=A0A1K0GBW8_9ACTN|nr:hypothetical protein [Couchioplanes caeruleus]OJF14730.1 hypothetical protein BG844_08280 [Couchioplanes caeruleus subsp. caeruleus]ROP27352.1 hypothetical protein EDD30_0021 [Couchioplanes caeruleus]
MKRVTRRLALWRADLDGGVCAAPEECAELLRDSGPVTVVLEHRDRGGAPTKRVFRSSLQQDVEWQFAGIDWPADLRPGVLVTVSWRAARDEVVVRTAALDEPLRVDGAVYFHEYDPKVVTREFVADESNRAKVLSAVRRQGRVFADGSAVLVEAELAAHCGLGRGARGAFLLRNAVEQLVREGFLTRLTGSTDSSGYPSYPAAEGQKTAEMLFYAPLVEPAPFPDEDDSGSAERQDHWVNGFVRRLPPGAQASERQRILHERAADDEQAGPGPLAPGFTYVKRHHRNG